MTSSRPRVVLLPDSGVDVGLGHVSRCVALGTAMATLGAHVSLLAGKEACAAALVRAAGIEAMAVAEGVNGASALERLEREGADVVVVDSYRATPEFLVGLRSAATRVVAVDDLGDRPLPVDVVVNGAVAAETLPYRHEAGTRLLLGARYALLDPRYAEAPPSGAADRVSRAFLSLGGGRHEAQLLAALAALDDVLDGRVHVDVAVGRDADVPQLAAAVRASRRRVTVHANAACLRALIETVDLAVSGAGMTLYELSATATPTVMVCMADNQRPNFEAFERAGAALAAGAAGDSGLGASLRAVVSRLVADRALRATLGARGRALVDGRGAERVARAITEAVASLR